jgi:poly [ADP-ribose] polymerase
MVSKSANYCFCNRERNTGLLLLGEVALGDMYEKKAAEMIQKLPPGRWGGREWLRC